MGATMRGPTPVFDGTDTATDAEVIRHSLAEPEGFAVVFDRYYGDIHGYAARRLGRGLADDVAAETFLIAFDRRHRYDTSCPGAGPWLYGIASNLIARHHRSEVRYYRAMARVAAGQAGEGTGEAFTDRIVLRLAAQARRGELAAALAKLHRRDRDVLLLVAWAEFTCEQAGQALGIPAGTARSRLHRARSKIRTVLHDTGAGFDHDSKDEDR